MPLPSYLLLFVSCVSATQQSSFKNHLKHCEAFSDSQHMTWVQSLGWEDPLEKGMATHSGILAWTIPRTEEPGGLQSIGSLRVGHD